MNVAELLKEDRWTVVELPHEGGAGVVRFRSPVLQAGEVGDYSQLLTVVWPYEDESTGAMPDEDDSREMELFENHLCDAVEQDACAVLVAVVTFDGARQWLFYTADVAEFAERLSSIPDFHGQPYPIELTTDEDPQWSYLRDQVLCRVPDEHMS